MPCEISSHMNSGVYIAEYDRWTDCAIPRTSSSSSSSYRDNTTTRYITPIPTVSTDYRSSISYYARYRRNCCALKVRAYSLIFFSSLLRLSFLISRVAALFRNRGCTVYRIHGSAGIYIYIRKALAPETRFLARRSIRLSFLWYCSAYDNLSIWVR